MSTLALPFQQEKFSPRPDSVKKTKMQLFLLDSLHKKWPAGKKAARPAGHLRPVSSLLPVSNCNKREFQDIRTVHSSVTPPTVAVIWVVPLPVLVTKPVSLIEATLVLLLAQVTPSLGPMIYHLPLSFFTFICQEVSLEDRVKSSLFSR